MICLQNLHQFQTRITGFRAWIHTLRKLLPKKPQRSWGKVIFSQASVILSTGGCLVRGGVQLVYRGGVPGPGGLLLRGVPGHRGLNTMLQGGAWSVYPLGRLLLRAVTAYSLLECDTCWT